MLILLHRGLTMGIMQLHCENILINNLHVLDMLPCSDHLPMVVTVDIDINVSIQTQVSTDDI